MFNIKLKILVISTILKSSSKKNLIELLLEHLIGMHIDKEKRRIDDHIENIRDSIKINSRLPKRIDKYHSAINAFHKPIR